MNKDEIKSLNTNLKAAKKGGFFVYYKDNRNVGDSAGHHLVITKKMAEAKTAFKVNKKKDSQITRGVIRYNAAAKSYFFQLADGGGTDRVQKGILKLSSCGATLLKGVQVVTEAPASPLENATSSTLDNAEAVEQDLLESFMSDFLSVAPDESLSHEAAFSQFSSDWQSASTAFNKSIKSVYRNLSAFIPTLEGAESETHQDSLAFYQEGIKGILFPKRSQLDTYFQELSVKAVNKVILKATLSMVRENMDHVKANPLVMHLRCYPRLPIRDDVKRCLLVMEKTDAQIQAIREELKSSR